MVLGPANEWQMGLVLSSRLGVEWAGAFGSCVSGFRPAHIFLPLLSPEGACVNHMWVGGAGLPLTLPRGWLSVSCVAISFFLTWGFSWSPGHPMLQEEAQKLTTFPFSRPASAPGVLTFMPGTVERGTGRTGHVCVFAEPAATPTQPSPPQAQGGCDPEDAGFSACDPLSRVLGCSASFCTPQPPGECEQQRDPHFQWTEVKGRSPPISLLDQEPSEKGTGSKRLCPTLL